MAIPSQSELSKVLSDWARTRTDVKAIWLFGSRVAGSGKEPRADSDWDIAIQFEGEDADKIRAEWFKNVDDIHAELEAKIGWQREHNSVWKGIQVEIHNPPQTENVSSAITSYAICVFKK